MSAANATRVHQSIIEMMMNARVNAGVTGHVNQYGWHRGVKSLDIVVRDGLVIQVEAIGEINIACRRKRHNLDL